MIPRERSIFHIAGDDEAVRDDENSKSMPELEKKSVVGLQLLIEISPSRNIVPVVTKSTMGHSRDKCCTASAAFLKFCFLCHKELKLQMNIFMYREQPFCSVECRDEKMMTDKRNELEVSMMAHRDHLHYRRLRESNVGVGGFTRRKGRLLVT